VRGTCCLYSLRVPENLESFLVMARTKKKGHGGKKSKVVIPILCSFCLGVDEFALCETWFAFWQLSLWKAGSC
jgi:hypothetical protein